MFPHDDRDNSCGCYAGCYYLLPPLVRPSSLLYVYISYIGTETSVHATRLQNKSTPVDGEINKVEFKGQRFYLVPEGERHHERCYGQSTADKQ